MKMRIYDRYVVDTCAIISYFNNVFKKADTNTLSDQVRQLIDWSLLEQRDIILVLPSAIFVEIYYKWFRNEEEQERIRYEVYEVLKKSKNVEIKPMIKDTFYELVNILEANVPANFDNHDKQVLATSMELQAELITSDSKLSLFVKKTGCIPGTLF